MDYYNLHIPEWLNDVDERKKKMDIGAILDKVKGELDAEVLKKMQQHQIPSSLMDKILDGIQSHIRQMKAEQYAEALVKAEINTQMLETEITEVKKQNEQVENYNAEPESKTRAGTTEEFLQELEERR